MIFDVREICGVDPEAENRLEEWREADLKPEYIQYRDEGCEHAPSCLECPFPRCLYEGGGIRHHRLKKLRNKEIRRMFQSGCTPEELTRLFKVSERTIYRAIQDKKQREIWRLN